MRIKSLHEEPGGTWRLASQCVVCLTEVERKLPVPKAEAESVEYLNFLQQLIRAHQ